MSTKNDNEPKGQLALPSSAVLGVPPGKFKCAMCGGIFDLHNNDEWSYEKAMEEFHRDFGDIPMECCYILCDDCYKKVCPSDHPKDDEAYKAETN